MRSKMTFEIHPCVQYAYDVDRIGRLAKEDHVRSSRKFSVAGPNEVA
ncbi:hypothetical protein GJW-30_1_00227 [Variibacter gotjawalensis]|uniref:Uncharacterized protein n=1 Tax=Variibacter gotjawalensis TaxID=1333996 RepID=A0A0S3PP49_9BRAD|nr:hypothetical protein [Variibacter gotjawalensis]RZS49891.1 hypothetical protein EV661_2337 [Variibacter gotjawalensis]BAT57719.1 hypothetical protein GJW-30_1_00227 [Variibacter gotjawalensis]